MRKLTDASTAQKQKLKTEKLNELKAKLDKLRKYGSGQYNMKSVLREKKRKSKVGRNELM